MSKNKKIFGSEKKYTSGGKGYRLNTTKLIIASIVILCAIVGGFFLYNKTGVQSADAQALIESGRFAKGITVNNENIGGLTFAEAQQKLDPVEFQKNENFAMTIVLDPDRHNIKGDDININTDLENVLTQAIVMGQTGNRGERKKELRKIEKEGLALSMRYVYDNDLLEQQLNSIQKKSGKSAQDATVKFEDGEIKYVEGSSGIKINREHLINEINTKINEGNEQFEIYAQTAITNPTITVQALKERLVRKSGVETKFKNSSTSRVNNVVKASGLLNGEMISPGETFSINSVLGARTSENGWSVATAIASGKYIDDVGGGVCQVSSTLYNAAVKSGLTVVERRHHTYPVDYLPKGQDAAISTGGPDLKLRNDYDFPVYIVSYASSSSKTMDVTIYGPKNTDGGSHVFNSKVIADEAPSAKASVSVNNNLLKGEYVEVKPRKNRVEVERWVDYVIDGQVVRTEKLVTDHYGSSVGEYAMGPGTEVDGTSGKPKGKKVDEEYLTKKREPTTESTTKETTKPTDKTTADTTTTAKKPSTTAETKTKADEE